MMVASSSLLKLEQSHHNRFINPELPSREMAYHLPRLPDEQTFDQQTVFTTQTRTFGSAEDQAFRLPVSTACKGIATRRGSENSSRKPTNDLFHATDLSPAQEEKAMVQDHVFQLTPNTHSSSSFGRSRSSPIHFPPPSKRLTAGSPILSKESGDPSNFKDSRMSEDMVDQHLTIDADNSPHQSFDGMFPKEEHYVPEFLNSSNLKFCKRTREEMAAMTSDINGNTIATSASNDSQNARHLSLSSTHSSSSSTTSKPATPSRPLSRTKSQQSSASMQKVPNFFFDDDDDDSWKICAVCSDKATGYHFNALTCEGCKGFFRRSMKNSKTFTCPYTGNCTITKSNRRQCQACRLQKCLRIGMKKECIMSSNQIMKKKNLMLNNKIKKNILEWRPTEFTPEKKELVDMIYHAHCQTNNPPVVNDEGVFGEERNPCGSPASSHSSGFSDLINRMTQDIVATAPGQTGASKAHMRHFSSIMEFSIKEIIKFCKKIPTFIHLSLKDQITLLKSGCTEILFIKANYTYDREQNALTCGPGKYYTRESFILGGMSEEYTDCYLKFHHDLSHMKLDDTELACMCAATLFSSDRDELEDRVAVELQQEQIVMALQSYSEHEHHCRLRFPKIMAYLTRLRTLNWHISRTLQKLQDTAAKEAITPLVLEVTPSV